MRTSIGLGLAVVATGAAALMAAPAPVAARKPKAKAKAAPAPVQQASAETARAIGELAGKFKWGVSPEDVLKQVTDETSARYDELIKQQHDPLKQDRIRHELDDQLDKIKTSYVKFEEAHTGWDVSLVDHEFAHNNGESMVVIWEKDQRRFLFFFDGKLYKQFIAFSADHPVLKGKSFDEFADLMQKRYGPAASTFRKQRTSDEQAFDHLEWPPAGDVELWAIDQTSVYNNYCLSLFLRSVTAQVEKSRKEHGTRAAAGNALVDAVTKPGGGPVADDNADIVDEITGRTTQRTTPVAAPAPTGGKRGKRGAAAAPDKRPVPRRDTSDPLDGTNF